jgi:hypothetical protein
VNLPPSVAALLGAIGTMLVPSFVIILSTYLAARSKNYANRRWPNDADMARREAQHAANAWGELYDAHDGRLSDLERRVRHLETGAESSSNDLTAMCATVSKVSKIERVLRKRNLWDSAKPGQV